MPAWQLCVESERSYLQRTDWQFDVILLSLASSFHPVHSGAYSLAEDYRYTVEAFQEMLAHLTPGGLLVATRWLQDPPSEDLRLFALAVTAAGSERGRPAAADRRLARLQHRHPAGQEWGLHARRAGSHPRNLPPAVPLT